MNYDAYADIFTASSATSSSSADTMIVSPGFETQTLLDSIYSVPLREIGSDKFMQTYCVSLERAAIQAHLTAGMIAASQSNLVATNSSDKLGDLLGSLGGGPYEEYIVEAFLENANKLEDLIKTLLALEYWRENVLFRRGRGDKNNQDEEEDDIEFEIEGGKRDVEDELLEEAYDSLNDVDGGEETNDDTSDGVTTGLASQLAENGNALRVAFIIHTETTIVSMLSLIFYKGIPASFLEGDGDQYLLSLVDYCARSMAFLGIPEASNPALRHQKNPLSASQLSKYLETRSCLDEIQDSVYETSYKTAVAAVSLSRYICENIDELPNSIASRMLDVHDFPLLMVPLIEEPPWTRRRQVEKVEDGRTSTKVVWEKLNDNNEWSEVLPEDLLLLTKNEGQPWLALFHLTASKTCRETYGLDEFRKAQLVRLRRYIHEALMDQVPVLQEVARYLDELSMLGVPAAGMRTASSSGLLLQRVDSLRELVVGDGGDVAGLIMNQWNDIFLHVTDAADDQLKRLCNEVYGGDTKDSEESHDNSVSVDHPQAPLLSTRTFEKATLRLESMIFELEDDGSEKKIVTTKVGTFQRIKLRINQMSEGGEAVAPQSQASAIVYFSDQSFEIVESTEVKLPTLNPKSSPDTFDELGIVLPDYYFKPKEWRQLGIVNTKSIVLQLGFGRLSHGLIPAGCTSVRGYALKVAFLSLPVEE